MLTDQDPPIDPVEALKKVQSLLSLASTSGDIDAIEQYVAAAKVIIDKALPAKKPLSLPDT
jgi:hypothetical protein